MRMFPILTGLILLGVSTAWADDLEDQKLEVKRLQERVELLEAKMAILLANQTPALNAAPVPQMTPSVALPPKREVNPPELIPEIGNIGAQVGLVLSGSSNPFHLNNGQDAAGFIDLPMFEPKALHGKISYEIRIGLSQAKTKFRTTSNVAQVANLTALTVLNPTNPIQNVIDAVNGTGTAPFPVSQVTETRSKLLQVIPFSLRYTSTALDRFHLRPYAVLGFGMFVTIHNQSPSLTGVRLDSTLPADQLALVKQVFGGGAPFGGPLVGGQITQSAELESRGLPFGAGNIDFGIHSGGGVELRLNRNFSLGFDGRFNRLSGGQSLGTFGTRLGFHF